MGRSAATVVLIALLACVAGCADTTEPAAAPPSPVQPASSSPTSSSPSSPPIDGALPPAVQGLEECPGQKDEPFVLRRGADRITGFARGRSTRVAVLTHQLRGTPCDLSGLGAALAREGYRVVAWTTDTSPTPRTLRALVAHERDRGARTVVLVGASAGGATSVVAAGTVDPQVDALVALSPADYAMTQGDVDRAVRRYSGPLMAVAGELDGAFAELPPRLADEHDGPELVEIAQGTADHGKDYVRRRTDPMVARILAFLDEQLPSR